MSKVLNLFEIKKTEVLLQKALEYFEDAVKDGYTDEIIEQIAGALITLELIKDKSNELQYEERVSLSEQLFELRDNVVDTIKSEGGVL